MSAQEPSRNIEIKARCADLDSARERAREAGAEFARVERQRDTYFRTGGGRLKLREVETEGGRRAELIDYLRADEGGPRVSRYTVKPVRLPGLLRRWLAWRRGVRVEVIKRRELWLWRGVRIHLDEVSGLGSFVELEAVVDHIGDEEEAGQRCRAMIDRLGIREEDILGVSYSDMLL